MSSLEELLCNLCANENLKKRALINFIYDAGISSPSAFLRSTDARAENRKQIKRMLVSSAHKNGWECSDPLAEKLIDALQMMVHDSRTKVKVFPDMKKQMPSPILFTAPHSILLRREGHSDHKPERKTWELANYFAQAENLNAICLCWTPVEKQRVKEWRSVTDEPDDTNMDPNFTDVNELRVSPWTRKLREVRARYTKRRPCLHVDMHGCRDPVPGSGAGSDIVVGLRAMERAGRSKEVDTLREMLELVFKYVLRDQSVNVRPQKDLTGALDDRWMTLTQQSLCLDGGSWTHSVQIEMSLSVRRRLSGSKPLATSVVQSIRLAWLITCSKFPKTRGYHELTKDEVEAWIQQCDHYYEVIKPRMEKKENGKSNVGKGTVPEKSKRKTEEEDDSDNGDDGDDVTRNVENRQPSGADHMSLDEVKARLIQEAEWLAGNWSKVAKTDNSNAQIQHPYPPSAVDLFSEWLITPLHHEQINHTDQIVDYIYTYCIVGSFNDWRPEPMSWQGDRFEFIIYVARAHHFQILYGCDFNRRFYPHVTDTGGAMHNLLVGPNSIGHGQNWSIYPDKRDAFNLGTRYIIELLVNDKMQPWSVTWERQAM